MSRTAQISAHWRDIVILSWPTVDGPLLPYLPPGLVLDRWQGAPYISLVCLRMESLRVLGIPAIPRSFAEVNLRFYARPGQPDDTRRGVVFLRQLVSSRLVAMGGRLLLREPMSVAPIRHQCGSTRTTADADLTMRYHWRHQGEEAFVRVAAGVEPFMAQPDSIEEFLTVRHWGYNGQSAGRIRSYRISREPWQLNLVTESELQRHAEYRWAGPFADVVSTPPASALFVSSSDARIHWPSSRRCYPPDASRAKLR